MAQGEYASGGGAVIRLRLRSKGDIREGAHAHFDYDDV